MPLIHKKGKAAFEHNVKTEMEHGKPQDQALAISYSVKRKAKKKAKGGMITPADQHLKDRPAYAEGGSISASNEKRPMPSDTHDDAAMTRRNSAKKAPMNDRATDRPERRQAGLGKIYPLKHPSMVPATGFTARLRTQEDDLQDTAAPSNPSEQPPEEYDYHSESHTPDPDMATAHSTSRKPYAAGGEALRDDERHLMESMSPSMDEGSEMAYSHNEAMADAHGSDPDMEAPHNPNQRKAYMQGGEVDTDHEMMDQPDEEDLMHHASIAAAIMAKRKAAQEDGMSGSADMNEAENYAKGGEVMEGHAHINSHGSMDTTDDDQADLSRNADEDANEEDQASFMSLEKENYSESDGLRQLDNPMDAVDHTDEREMSQHEEHSGSLADKVRRKMKQRSPITE